ncbi:probable E3 ubiquitin-protein ligase HERC3 [Tetranychus urticae]|uniref:HECT domain-containing protein n=1 Tax=Tetranychus urticae TaxID=32264 RepID=T1KJW1_TETUR|nr:probable E3 ubiquitin-protein ligase HERC3 [Tetranychus urticae]
MSVFSFGSTSFHELALGAIEQPFISTPTQIDLNKHLKAAFGETVNCSSETSCDTVNDHGLLSEDLFKFKVEQVTGGRNHIIILLHDEEKSKSILLSCGSNERQQLGREGSWSKLLAVQNFGSHFVNQVSCGYFHNSILTDAGQIFSWGCNQFGQLGLAKDFESIGKPSLIKILAHQCVIQICSGAHHSLALTKNGEIYSWGANNLGQLGLGYKNPSANKPHLITSLQASPIFSISSGSYHSFGLSCTGALYGWGKNEFGQLGVGDNEHRSTPTCLTHLRNQKISFVSGGEDFTAALTEDGGIFTWGAGMYGQTGHGVKGNELFPKRILEMIGNKVTQVACGRCHMLLLVNSDKIYACGLNGCGQLGLSHNENKLIPVSLSKIDTIRVNDKITKSAITSEKIVTSRSLKNSDVDMEFEEENKALKYEQNYQIATSLGDHSFIIVGLTSEPIIYNFWNKKTIISKFDNSMLEAFTYTPALAPIPIEHLDYIELTFGSIPCWNASYVDRSKPLPSIDWNSLRQGFQFLEQIKDNRYNEVIFEIIENNILPQLPTNLDDKIDSEIARIYLILPMMHFFSSEILSRELLDRLIIGYAKSSLRLISSNTGLSVLENWFKDEYNAFLSRRLVRIYKKLIVKLLSEQVTKHSLEESPNNERVYTYDPLDHPFENSNPQRRDTRPRFRIDPNIQEYLTICLEYIQLHFKVSQKSGTLSYKEFYITEISDLVDISRDYIYWLCRAQRSHSKLDLYLCNYPFIFDTKAKSLILETDSSLQQRNAAENALYRNLVFASVISATGPEDPHLVISVSRENLIRDTISQFLSNGTNINFKKPLKVKFEGEDAIDAGMGMKKEFFLLVLREILDPKYGMFIEYKDTNTIWFNPKERDYLVYELIGIICGLAIYNQAIINLPFPLVLYKKMLGEDLCLDDLGSIDATLTRNLREILNPSYTPDEFDSIYGDLNFTISLEIFGSPVDYNLIENGENVKLTLDNRQSYVDLYWKFILIECIEHQYSAFKKGFHRVVDYEILKFFHAEELLELVTGQEAEDWAELEESASYKAPFNKLHPTIIMFWKVFHSFTDPQRKQFLLFLTGSDRVPIQGMKYLRIGIQPMKVSQEHLPVAHTCFNILDLPEVYTSEDKMRSKILQAIENSSGFTLA